MVILVRIFTFLTGDFPNSFERSLFALFLPVSYYFGPVYNSLCLSFVVLTKKMCTFFDNIVEKIECL